jgi:hypothetical protein
LARSMVDAVVSGTGQHEGPVFENRDIRAIVESLESQRRSFSRRSRVQGDQEKQA